MHKVKGKGESETPGFKWGTGEKGQTCKQVLHLSFPWLSFSLVTLAVPLSPADFPGLRCPERQVAVCGLMTFLLAMPLVFVFWAFM